MFLFSLLFPTVGRVRGGTGGKLTGPQVLFVWLVGFLFVYLFVCLFCFLLLFFFFLVPLSPGPGVVPLSPLREVHALSGMELGGATILAPSCQLCLSVTDTG